ncbi:NADPH-dependent FMN reductase [Poseidonocella sedimentorum]|uniref:NAD(P)H-dependent FMN reductase n=1 Tax=Poseidonocella sedimentorum TaxID=871652 RepID=A0A1I6CUR0_9RHOB|nr:NAD(P)H-dependent oxidoreductase [Poseidonocella sedimentorum]SFQ96955.1 NAD(P)H-dependent FMN reductase [Poseidonocella sedimentorum]
MKLLAFAATNSRISINRTLVEYAAGRLGATVLPDAEVTLLDLNTFEMPIYSVDREAASGIPQAARDFHDAIGDADAVLVSFAEHNGSVTSAWKNLFDWMSRIDAQVWQGKPVIFLAATPGPRAGAGVLGQQAQLAPYFGADLRGVQGIGTWGEAWDAETGSLSRPEDIAALDATLSGLVAAPAQKGAAA